MDVTDFRPNSHRYKEEQKETSSERKVEKVVKGKVRVKKKSEASRLKDVFISEDISNVKSYVLDDLIIPTIKRTIVDAIKNSAEMIFLGKINSSRSSNSGYVSYRDYGRRDDEYRRSSRRSSVCSVETIVFDTWDDANDVLGGMDDLLRRYGMVTVADFYDLAGTSGYFTDSKYGWDSLRSAEVVRVNDGYIIRLPKAKPMN